MKKFLLSLVALLLPIMAIAQQKIGVVNTQVLMSSMPEMTAAQTRLQELDKKYTAELDAMNADYKKKAEAYIKEQPNLTETLDKSRQQELIDMQNRIQQSANALQQDLEKQQQTLMAPIQKKVLDAIKAVGDENSLAYICEAGMMLYMGSSAMDITDKVKAKLGIK